MEIRYRQKHNLPIIDRNPLIEEHLPLRRLPRRASLRSTKEPDPDEMPKGDWFARLQPQDKKAYWQSCTLDIHPTYIGVYAKNLLGESVFTFNGDNLRWISSPKSVGKNNLLWLDVDHDGLWLLIGIQMPPAELKNFITALEALMSSDLQLRRNRQRPNIRLAPVNAVHVQPTTTGEWKEMDSIQLYLTPLYLVELREELAVNQYRLDAITGVNIERVSGSADDHLLHIRMVGALHTYVLSQWDSLYSELRNLNK